tara:strand:- start:502 stop:708 length:207 start_codon:yes stop_codon:yes gene_type:complete
MRNRATILRKLEQLGGVIRVLKGIVNRQEPIETYIVNINKAEGLLEEVMDFVETEDMTAQERNTSLPR